ncbi:MAG: hypothetical protein R3F24_11700 [Gammaproteobacteria bacterium]
MNAVGKVLSLAGTLLLSNSIAIADVGGGAPGIHVAGQAIDGTLVLDTSASNLSAWESPGLTMATDTVTEAAPALLVIGHLESWNKKTGELTVSGQHLVLDEAARILDAPRDIDAVLNTENLPWYLHTGSYVAVAGDSFGGGENLATHIIRLSNDAKPGTMPLFIRGSLDLVDSTQGIAYLGGMRLDLNSANQGELPTTGNMVELVAMQSGAANAVVTEYSGLDSMSTSTDGASKVAGIHGSGVKGIHGSGVRGIHGSGVKGIHGSGVRGIHGSGVKGIHGSGVRGIHGSGVKGIHGSGVKGIHGSGVRGIHGSGAR